VATQRHRKPENWLPAVEERGSGCQIEQAISPATQASEALLMGLRLAEGIDLGELSARVAIPAERLFDAAEAAKLEALGLLLRDDNHLTITPQGMPLLDAILPRLIPDALVEA
jgi:oxygen-independent coproporphyrinogen-3 oxidase